MSRIRPLSYIEPSGGLVSPGSVLTLVRGSRGLTGQWAAPIAEEVLDSQDPALTVADMARAYNQLVWDFGRLSVLSTTPRMWFGEAGSTGLRFRVYDPTEGIFVETQYVPYTGDQNTLALADVITAMNTALGNTDGVQLISTGGSVSLLVKDGYSVEFVSVTPPGSYDTPLRIMRRLLTDIPGDGLAASYTGPAMIQGQPLPGPIAGLYPIPLAPGLLSASEITDTSMRLSWTVPFQPIGISGLRFYVFQDGVKVGTVTDGSATFLVTGLTAGQTYTMSVMAATDYEVSVGNPTADVQTTTDVTLAPPDMMLATGVGTISNIEIPGGNLSGVYVEVGLNKTGVPFSAAADTITMQLEFNYNPSDPLSTWIAYEGESLPTYYTPGITYVPPEEPEVKGTWTSNYEYFDTQPIRFYGLDPQIGYRVRAKYFINDPTYGESAWSDFTPAIISGNPSIQLTVGPESNEDTLIIAWEWPYPNMHNLSFYNVELTRNPGAFNPGIIPIVDDSGTGMSVPFSLLQPGETYTVDGTLFYDAPYDYHKALLTLNQVEHTMSGAAIPIPDVSSVVGGETTISVAVNPPPSPPPTLIATIVGVYYDAETVNLVGEYTFGPDQSPMEVTGMMPGQMFFVKARYRAEDLSLGNWSAPQSVNTVIPAPALSVGSVTSDSITVSWTPVSSGYVYYLRLTLVRNDGLASDVVEIITDAITTTSFTFENGTVVPSQQYTIYGSYSTDGFTFESAGADTGTIQTPATVFGPIATGFLRRYDVERASIERDGSVEGTVAGTIEGTGFLIPDGSAWVGKSFNTISFPKMYDAYFSDEVGTVTNFSLDYATLVVRIFTSDINNPTSTRTLVTSKTLLITDPPTSFSDEHIVTLDTTVTLAVGSIIEFRSIKPLLYAGFDNTEEGKTPIPAQLIETATLEETSGTYTITNLGPLCNFDLVL